VVGQALVGIEHAAEEQLNPVGWDDREHGVAVDVTVDVGDDVEVRLAEADEALDAGHEAW